MNKKKEFKSMDKERRFLERDKGINLSRFIEYVGGYPSKIPFECVRDFIKEILDFIENNDDGYIDFIKFSAGEKLIC